MNWVSNAAGREVPTVRRDRAFTAYRGIDQDPLVNQKVGSPIRHVRDYPASGDKRTPDLKQALQRAGLASGMVISTHHHFRNGDRVAAQIFAAARALGVKDLVWFPSAVFPCHAELIPYLEDGTIHHIQGSLNGPLGDFATSGRMRDLAVLRSHGGRARSLMEGDMTVDIAVIAAPACDCFGNMTGTLGPSACGGLGFAVADAEYAHHVIAMTDHLVEFPCVPWQIAGNQVDQVVVTDEIGDPSQILSGTTLPSKSPEARAIAQYAADFVFETGILREGWSFQAGAGGTSLLFTLFVRRLMEREGLRASFVRGGSSHHLVEMLESGRVGAILDGQTFDLEGVRSLRENPNHVMTTPFTSYVAHTKGNFASMLDCAVLGATEVDLDFNANVVTHSDGRLLHGIGGWQDALRSQCTILAIPTLRNRIPMIRDRVTTLCGPGELVDVVVTERGIAINPRRSDLVAKAQGQGLPLTTLEELKAHAESLAGGAPADLLVERDPIGLITWVDGTILDTVWLPTHLKQRL
jgi:citrate lyase subunit alpha/citrate CoA-transferase